MSGLIVEIVGTVNVTITVHVVVLVGFIAVVIVIFAGGAVPMAAAAVGSARVGGGGQRGNENQETGESQGGKFFSHGKTSFFA